MRFRVALEPTEPMRPRAAVPLALLSIAWLAYWLAPPVVCYLSGRETVATITSYLPRKDDEGRDIHDHEFSYDGHVAVQRFSQRYPIGHRRAVLYLPSRPSWVVSGSRDKSLWAVIDECTNGVGLAIFSALAVIFTMHAVVSLRHARRRTAAVAEAAAQP